MIRQQQLLITTQLPAMISYNNGKSIESLNNARIYTYRGEKIAGFELQGIRMLCLPQYLSIIILIATSLYDLFTFQAYQTFLKNVISGLHTVHSKLKRLQIQLVICNVEQVRALRNLGAIQQGVNRCKLISCNDFDQLYDDCYKIHHRSDRPTKRSVEWRNTPDDRNEKPKYTSGSIAVPFTATQRIALQHLMATAAIAMTASEPPRSADQMMDTTFPDHESSENSESSSILITPRTASLSPLPLNLTKNADNHQCENDNDASQKKISSDNSKYIIHRKDYVDQDAATEDVEVLQAMLSKLITLIEMATLNLKTERELVESEKCKLLITALICKLQRDLECKQKEYDKIQRELSMEQQKASKYKFIL
uniref:Ski_Sno domain-containing protein n=1 Tax=Elaeophora elaphi TaxID=1147741 RepID=A0A0R3RL84_9BILA